MSIGQRVATAIAVLSVLAGGAATAVSRFQLAQEREARARCSRRLEGLRELQGAASAELAGYRAAIDEQNRQLAHLKAESEALTQRATVAEQQAREVRVVYRDRVRRVLVAPVPTKCEEATRWAADQARESVQLWRGSSSP